MGKLAGVWKRVKEIAKTAGGKIKAGLSWLNEMYRNGGKKYIEPLVQKLPGGTVLQEVVDAGSNALHNYDEAKGTVADTKGAEKLYSAIDDGIDVYNAYKDGGALAAARKLNDKTTGGSKWAEMAKNRGKPGVSVGYRGILPTPKPTHPLPQAFLDQLPKPSPKEHW